VVPAPVGTIGSAVRITFHGVRGSSPASGPEFGRTGGGTSCLSLSLGDAPASVILDAGTGIQRLARELGHRPYRGVILLTHLHWDHVHGLPFFPPADQEGAEVTLVQPAQGDPVEVLSAAMSPPHFPIRPTDLRGSWTHVGLEPGRSSWRVDGAEVAVTAAEVAHKGGRTYGYRIESGGRSLCYVPDALDDDDEVIVELADGVDLLLRGAPFVAAEQERADAFGHGTVEHALVVAERAGVGRLVVTHHGPFRTDDELDAIAERTGAELATEGLTLDV
jgi:phosphoribosyl 1,2-cyclic phosphodiesterase